VQDYSFESAFQHISQGGGNAIAIFQANKAEDSRNEMFNAVLAFFADGQNVEIKNVIDKNYIGLCVHRPETEKIISFEMFNLDKRSWNPIVDWVRCYDIDRMASDLQSIENKKNIRFIIFNISGDAGNCLNVALIDQFKQMNIPVLVNVDSSIWDQIYPKLDTGNND